MTGKCSKQENCVSKSIGCSGCSFQHFDKIQTNHNKALEFLKKEYFKLCSDPAKRRGTGGRIAIDAPMRDLVLKEAKKIIPGFPDIREIDPKNLKTKLMLKGEEVVFKIKCDGAFYFNNKYIFYELKGYGDNTNDVLSAITAAHVLNEIPDYRNCRYYYIGINSGKKTNAGGLKRDHFFDANRIKVTPYIKWAESKDLIKFYGILDILDILKEIKEYCG